MRDRIEIMKKIETRETKEQIGQDNGEKLIDTNRDKYT